ncbi:amino acid adenylation domain-containing protein [Sphaerimonospora sp. CA-214678]|uniref:amino acid adenylation domain-containing protein n=1 Tax=Sphaerimonospora sp. CA-214678 TaxID=3240029 RepID=UPI003D8D0430
MTWTFRGPAVSGRTIHDAVVAAARRDPERIAVRCEEHAISYAELVTDAERIARHLIGTGVSPGGVVPVVARRTADLPAVLLGVLLAGAAYALLDVRWPVSRIASLLEAMRPAVVLADHTGAEHLAGAALECVPFAELDPKTDQALPEVTPDDVATLFWTSGSTGEPKAVLSPHRATTRLFGADPCVPYGRAPRMISAAAVAWDAFTLELWGMLTRGGTVLLHEDDVLLPASVRAYIADFGATHLFLTPALFDVLVTADVECFGGLRVLTLGGDRPSVENCRKLMDAFPSIELYNGYGPVESCVFVTTHRIGRTDLDGDGGIPVGRPVAGTDIYVVRDGAPVPGGEPGEIAIGGTGLARGYLGDPRRTAEVFRDLVVEGGTRRVYLTGDRGWLDGTGTLHFGGRLDSQFKIAGHRIEPGEIEAAARAAGCAQAVAMPVTRRNGTRCIALFAVPSEGRVTDESVRAALRERLPGYMVPAAVHLLDVFPFMENTKINRRMLASRFGYAP